MVLTGEEEKREIRKSVKTVLFFFFGCLNVVVFEAGAQFLRQEIRRNTRARKRVAFLQELSRA